MKNNKDDDNSSHFSSAKTNSSSIGEDSDIFPKTRPRGGVKSKGNNFQPVRHTVAIPITSFNGVSHNASFQSKLLFFNGGKPRPKFQHVPINHDKVITEENDKIDIKLKKIGSIKDDKIKKPKNDKDDIDSNININKIVETKNNYNSNKNNESDSKKNKNFVKKNTICYNSNQLHSFNIDPKTSSSNKSWGNNDKKTEDKKTSSHFKLKSLKDQWDFHKILLDYNILDFTSKFILLIFIYFIFSDL